MKPVTGKWKPEPEWKGSRDSDDGEEVVVDTQGVGAVATPQDGEDGGDTADGHAGTADPPTTLAKKGELVDATVKSKRAPRKISSTAHANYRALKIKNKHSKGKGVGKFGRRR